jgi:hypothetical protein
MEILLSSTQTNELFICDISMEHMGAKSGVSYFPLKMETTNISETVQNQSLFSHNTLQLPNKNWMTVTCLVW